jgi:hypothetical protein
MELKINGVKKRSISYPPVARFEFPVYVSRTIDANPEAI